VEFARATQLLHG
jgi:hypothetical protein